MQPAIIHKDQVLTFSEWTTWNNQPASAWTWRPDAELRDQMPWLPVSISGQTLDKAKAIVDSYLDNVQRNQDLYQTTQQATAAWVAEGSIKGYNND